MEPVQVSFTSKYIDGAQTHISTTTGDTHAGATIGDTTQHFPTRPDTTITPFTFPPPIAHAETSLTWLANALASTNTGAFTSAEHTWRNLANTLTTVINVSLMSAIHAEATTTIAQAQARGCTHRRCLPPTPPQAAAALLPQH